MPQCAPSAAIDTLQPYNGLPDLPPPSDHLETTSPLKKIIVARSSLAELKGACQSVPNPDLMLNAVVLQEGKDGSEIENIVTTQDEQFRAAAAAEVGASVPTAKTSTFWSNSVSPSDSSSPSCRRASCRPPSTP